MPDNASMANTRSAGTRRVAIQRDTLPCDRKPSLLASADWPPTASHARSMGDLTHTDSDIALINALFVNSVNACRAKPLPQTRRMGREADLPPSEFWSRLVLAWGAKGLPTSQNGVAKELGMAGNGTTGRWYRGDTKPLPEELVEIARRGDVTVDWLLTGEQPQSRVPPESELGRLLKIWSELRPENRPHLIESAEDRLARQRHPVSTDVSAIEQKKRAGTR